MKPKSIAGQITLNGAVWALVLAFFTGLILTDLHRNLSERSFDERLGIVLKILVGELAGQLDQPADLLPPSNLGEPRYELPLSGWYWTVSKAGSDAIMLSSASLVGGTFQLQQQDQPTAATDFIAKGYATGPDNQHLRVVTRLIEFSQDQRFVIRVTGNLQELDKQVRDFQRSAWFTMAAVSVIALFIVLWLVSRALRPLRQIEERLKDVAEGQADVIEGAYPSEISGLVEETNALILSKRDTLERARTQVGNLAHALKTPLSVIVNETREIEGPAGDRISEQTMVMRDQVDFYLDRARIAAQRNIVGVITKIDPPLAKLVNVMEKLYGREGIHLSMEGETDLLFAGEERDLEEMSGNVLDNACKWASSRVVLTTESYSEQLEQRRRPSEHWLKLIVEDDGPGLSEEEMQDVVRRGKRLDESKPGSGLGLSIVKELVGLYNGEMMLSRSDMGGLKVTLLLPAK